MLRKEYWISELAELSGVSTRTVRYYIKEGLLPQPEIRGKYAVFTDEYRQRLRLIKILKDAYLPLNRIRELLNTLTYQELITLLDEFEKDPVIAMAGLQAAPAISQSQLYQISQSAMEPDLARTGNALEYIQQLREGRPALDKIETRNAPGSQLQIRRYAVGSPQHGDTWQRIRLAPGLELHIRQPMTARREQLIDDLIELVRNRRLSHREVLRNANTTFENQNGRSTDLQQRPHQPHLGDRINRPRRKPRA